MNLGLLDKLVISLMWQNLQAPSSTYLVSPMPWLILSVVTFWMSVWRTWASWLTSLPSIGKLMKSSVLRLQRMKLPGCASPVLVDVSTGVAQVVVPDAFRQTVI